MKNWIIIVTLFSAVVTVSMGFEYAAIQDYNSQLRDAQYSPDRFDLADMVPWSLALLGYVAVVVVLYQNRDVLEGRKARRKRKV